MNAARSNQPYGAVIRRCIERAAPRGYEAAMTDIRTRRRAGAKAGYSLLEILVVLAIIALIATLVGPRLLSQLDRSKITTAKAQIRSLETSLETMRLDIGRFPTDSEGLRLLVEKPADTAAPGWLGPYLDGRLPPDPWGAAYVYKSPPEGADKPIILSLGADGKEGGEGLNADVSSADIR
jgi:general secretion pathway protein G